MRKNILLLVILIIFAGLRGNTYARPVEQDFNITLPNHTSRIEAGRILTINWLNYSYSARNISRLNIYIVKGDIIVYTIAKDVFNNGKYITRLPPDFKPGKYQVEISSVDRTSYALSKTFQIIPEIPIKIIQPDSTSVWKQGGEYKIKWSAKGNKIYINLLKIIVPLKSSSLKEIEKSIPINELISRLKIADAVDNKGEYLWHIPPSLEDGNYIIAIRVLPIKEIKYSSPFVIKKSGSGK